ncbi:hypothetical protein NA57DRAFT_72981 [Rhizodiscina lignyota]|uniref:Uncharacterized protein n=1 Tax=Rhizodiscina lignyota TaxID=1504668 RepID=A0A9P4IH03_9PEZI|nr:hypothetical protein NA57DRAFT_72981 [Rhizodiscina lignyota]
MGRDSQQPYMYDPPPSVDTFDPRAFTRKSWQPAPPPKPKKEGPLLEPSVDFNKHPDSYLIVPYGNVDAKPMSKRTKGGIKWVRWIQLVFRAVQLVGAVGTLIAAICVKGTQNTEGWIIRIPPGVDILSILYAIYHLFRPAKGRTPTSSASYHFFACFVDTGSIPFYVFTAMLANNNYLQKPGTSGRWRTFFSSKQTTDTIFLALWLLGAVMAGLHFISLIMDLYLVIIFRKIARLPPDMNPLEDNLTKRPKKNKSKHKYKDSNATLAVSESSDIKRASAMSDSSLTVTHPSPDRNSKSREPLLPDVAARNISFFHTRNDSNTTFNPHNPRTARLSRVALDNEEKRSMYQQPMSSRASHVDTKSVREPTLAEHRASLVQNSSASLALPRPITARDSANSFVSAMSTPNNRPNTRQADSPVSPIMDDPKSDNWFVVEKDSTSSFQSSKSGGRPTHSRSKSQYDFEDDSNSLNLYTSGTVRRPHSYQPVPQTHIDTSPPPMRPLGMNPPSPMYPAPLQPLPKDKDADELSIDSGSHYSNSTADDAAPAPIVPAHTHGRNSTPKGRYYGDLATATRSIMRGNSPIGPPSPSSYDFAAPPPDVPRHSPASKKEDKRPRSWLGAGLAAAYDYTASPSLSGTGSARSRNSVAEAANPNLYSTDRSPYLQQGGWGSAARNSYAGTGSPAGSYMNGKGHEMERERGTPTRVISRSGVEYEGVDVLGVGASGGRRRDVSGKIAEEGRGGGFGFGGGWGMRGRKVSPAVVQG